MKKNFIKLMTFALIATGVGVLGSCKDYQEDRIIEIQALNQKKLNEAVADLQGKLDAAKAELQAKIDEAACKCTPVDLSGLQGQIDDINDAIEQLMGKQTVTPDELTYAIGNALSGYWTGERVEAAIEEAIAGIEPGLDEAAALELIKHTITKQFIIDLIGEATPGLTKEEVEQMIEEALVICDCSEKIEAINDTLEEVKDALSQHGDDIAALYNSYSSLAGLYSALSTSIGNLEDDVEDIQDDIELIEGSLAELEAQVLQNQFDINFLDMRVSLLETLTDGIHEEMHEQIDELRAEAAENTALLVAYTEALYDALAEDLAEYMNANDAKIETIEFQVNEIIKSLKILDEWNHDLDAAVEKNANDIKEIKDAVKKLTEDVEKIQNYLKSQITGIIVQQTKNPVLNINLPGFTSNLLLGYSAEMQVSEPFDFHGTPIVSGEVKSENAGKMFLTINPLERDFTGVELDLVNSQGEKSGIVLTDIQPSTEVLTMGVGTRGQQNYLYEGTAKIVDAAATRPTINREALAEVAKEMHNKPSMANLKNLFTTAIANANNVAPALGVQAQWTDDNEETHSVVSKFDVAAVTVKPLGYQSLQAMSSNNIPGYNRLTSAIDRIAGNVKTQLNKNNKLTETIDKIKATINSIEIKQIDLSDKNLNVEVAQFLVVPGTNVKLERVAGTDKVNVTIETTTFSEPIIIPGLVSIDKVGDALAEVRNARGVLLGYEKATMFKITSNISVEDQVQSVVDGINPTLTSLKDAVASMNNILNDINGTDGMFSGAVDKVTDKIHGVLDRINNKFGKVFNLNHWLQPCLVLDTEKGSTILSGVENLPQKVKGGDMTLIATSYSGEILAPAYKKFVTVESVGGANSSKIALPTQAVNGSKVDFPIQLTEGTWKITYEAVDYYGKVATVTRYITVE